ncbi:MAG: 50S ribosomal protein L29 [Armatimonadota bacterium]
MKLNERQDLHKMTKEQLLTELTEAERTYLNFRFDAGLKRLTNSAGMHNSRKRIALLKTLIREKELLAEHNYTSMDEYKAHVVAERKAYRESKKAR